MTKISVGAPISHKPTNLKRVKPMKQVIQNLQEPYAVSKLSSPSKRRRLLCCLVSETRHAVQSLITQSHEVLATPVIRMRTSFTYSQLQTLEETFSEQSRISRLHAEQIAGKFELPVECITSWFSNRRDLQRKRDERRLKLEKTRAWNELLYLISFIDRLLYLYYKKFLKVAVYLCMIPTLNLSCAQCSTGPDGWQGTTIFH